MIEKIPVPDIGDFKDVAIIEVSVSAGDTVAVEDTLITLETDKASLDIPSPVSGKVVAVKVKVGDTVSQGDLVAEIEVSETVAEPESSVAVETPASPPPPPATENAAPPETAVGGVQKASVPDIGDFKDVAVIEVSVSAGDTVAAEDTLITLETEKASLDIPSPVSGKVVAVKVKVGDKVSQGDLIAEIEHSAAPAVSAAPAAVPEPSPPASTPTPAVSASPAPPDRPRSLSSSKVVESRTSFSKAHATPVVRKIAREFGVDLANVVGSGPKGRILKEDIQRYVKLELSKAGSELPSVFEGIPNSPDIDFTKWGSVELHPISRIKKISGANLRRNWLLAPHVTQFDEADITDMEAFRKSLSEKAKEGGYKMTPLAFIIKAVAAALKLHPRVNSSLSADGEALVVKSYWNIGVAVDTPNGLVVPVVKDADKKGLIAIAQELAELSARAREGKLSVGEMQGGTFSISSLGGIGGTMFTPIINVPEVAILGVGRSRMMPVWDGTAFQPRLMLPLALSYDHRVIDGAEGARFITELSAQLQDTRLLAL